MKKLVALYETPADPSEFDSHYFGVHIPLVERYPGLRRLETTRIESSPLGEMKFYLMSEMYFDDKDSLEAALASKEGKAVARDLLGFAAKNVRIFQGDVSTGRR